MRCRSGSRLLTDMASPYPQESAYPLAPLTAKWGWIVALGVVYLIAGIVALGSVVAATAASVFVVGIMMVIAGVAEVSTPSVQHLGPIFLLAHSRRTQHRRRLRRLLKSVLGRGVGSHSFWARRWSPRASCASTSASICSTNRPRSGSSSPA